VVLTDFPERFVRRPLFVSEKHTPHVVTSWRPHGKGAVLTLRGIDTVEAAESLRDTLLYASATDLEPLPEGHCYVHQIIGLPVTTQEGRILGDVADVLSLPSNDVYVIRSSDGRELLLPAIRDAVVSIDLVKGELVVRDGWALD
jgi:16S rRNA processing protein RimM